MRQIDAGKLIRLRANRPRLLAAACLLFWALAGSTPPARAVGSLNSLPFHSVTDDVNHDPSVADCNNNGIPDDEDIAQGTSSDCNNNTIPDECELDGPPERTVYFNSAMLRIPPLGTAGITTHDAVVSDFGPVVDLHVTINITHTYDEDLLISIVHDGVTVVLSDSNGLWMDDYLETTFDDHAAVPISDGTPPFTGTFQPEEPLAGFAGLDKNGTWTLIVEDQFTGDTGVLLDWTLEVFTPGVPNLNDCQPNGIPDDCDPDSDGDLAPDDCEACPLEPALTQPDEPAGEMTCADGIDNDCDGATDAADADCAGTCVCGDLDGDGSATDLNDFAVLARCASYTGPTGRCSPAEFNCSDLNGDAVVDLNDFNIFALWFSQTSTQTVPNCDQNLGAGSAGRQP
jgi:subtilisin-like proprotein convertase family protein